MPGERTSWDTTTRSVPLMMNVPLSVITGKSPMKTVWLLISPVVLLVNSAVTKSGAAYVMSLSLHSSTEALTSSKRGSEKDSDIEPEKSSIGEISVRISSRPPAGFSSPASMRRWNHASSPTSHSNDWVCRSSRSGTRKGSRIFAKDTRVGAQDLRTHRLLLTRGHRPGFRTRGGVLDERETPHARANLDEGSAKRQSSRKCSRCR